MLLDAVATLKAWLHATVLGQFPFLERGAFQILDFLSGPITGVNTRFHWFQLLETILLAAFVYFTGRHVVPRGGWRGFLRYCFPKEMYAHPSAKLDYKLALLNAGFGFLFNITWRINVLVMTPLLLGWMTWMFGPGTQSIEWTWPWLIAITFLVILAEDFASYTYHYAEHKIPLLWAFHKVHHSAEVLTPITGMRTHPLEYALVGSWRSIFVSLVMAPVLYFFTGPLSELHILGIGAFVVIHGALGLQLQHSHVWLSFGPKIERFIYSPALHQIHHSQAPQHQDKNLGVTFAIWDWMFGTLYLPKGPEKLTFGVAGEDRQPHANLFAAWFRPCWDAVPMRDKLVDLNARLFGNWVRDWAIRFNLIPEPPTGPGSARPVSR